MRTMLVNMVWAFSGDGKWKSRQQLSDYIRNTTTLALPPNQQVCITRFLYALILVVSD